MAFDAGTVVGKLELDARQFREELRRMSGRLDQLQGETGQAKRGLFGFAGQIAATAAAMGAALLSITALRAGFRGITEGLKTASSDAAEFEFTVQKLAVSMSQAGFRSVATFTESMKEFASEIQNATSFSDGFVLETSQLLTVLGVSQDKLKQYTKAVLDYSAATGQDAVNAARQFGKTFGGTLGELAESLPALKVLTQEELKAGAAFEFAANAFGGFAEKVADTSKGLSDQLTNAVGDFSKQVGAVINPFLDELKRAGISVLKELTTVVEENRGAIAETFQGLAIGILDFVPTAIDSITSMRVAFIEIRSTVAGLGALFSGVFGELALQVQEATQAVNEFGLKLGLGNAEAIAAQREEIEALRATIDAAAEEYGQITREAEAAADAARDQGNALRERLLPILEQAKEKIRGISTDFASGEKAAQGLTSATRTAASNTEDLAAAAAAARSELAGAADEANNLEGATAGAAQSLSIASGRPGGTSAGLDLDDPFSALGALQSAQRAERQAAFSGYGFVRRAASNVASQVQQAAQAQLDQAFSQFTSDLVNELNRNGVFNPSERQSYINERISEAQRLGVLPKTRTASSIIGGVGSIT